MIKWGFEKQLQFKRLIESEIKSGNVGHSIIISGNSLEMLKIISREVSKLLICANRNLCDECQSCKLFEAGSSTDFFEFEKIGIDDVRALKTNLLLSTDSNGRVVVIQLAEKVSIPAMNSLLKILEEPPSKVYFIITTLNYKDLLPTILSRSRVYKLNSSEFGAIDFKWGEKLKSLKSPAKAIILAEELSELEMDELNLFFIEFVSYLKKSDQYFFAEDAQYIYGLINQNVNRRIALEVLFLRYLRKCGIVQLI